MKSFRFFDNANLASAFRQRVQGTLYTNEPHSKTSKYWRIYAAIAQDAGEDITNKPFVVVWV